MKKLKNIYNVSANIVHKVEKSLLVFFLSLMITLSFLQIILRFLSASIEWFDIVVKYSVLWLGMIAASIATYEHKHIKIDLIGRFAKGRLKSVVLLITNLFASTVSGILCYASTIYIIYFEITSTDPAPFLNIPRWVLLLIIPISFGTISIRFLLRSVQKIYNIIKKIEEPEEETIDLDMIENNNKKVTKKV